MSKELEAWASLVVGVIGAKEDSMSYVQEVRNVKSIGGATSNEQSIGWKDVKQEPVSGLGENFNNVNPGAKIGLKEESSIVRMGPRVNVRLNEEEVCPVQLR